MDIEPRHVRETRIAAAVALVALAAGVASDFLLDFWARNAMLTSVVANLLVFMVGVAVVNEYLAGRSARRWRLLGQFVLLELGGSARDVWIVLAERLGRLGVVLGDDIKGHPTSLPDVGDAEWTRRNLSETIELAIILDRDFLEMADSIVPREWWKELEGLDREAHYRYLVRSSGRSGGP